MDNISFLKVHSSNIELLRQKDTHAFSEGETPIFNSGSDLVSLGGELVNEPSKKWTILNYAAADNNLVSIIDNVIDLESIGSDENINFLVQLDIGRGDFPDKNVASGAKRYYLNQSDDLNQISSPVLQDLGKINMSDPNVLADFVTWGIKNYPAENYMVFISSHGKFWTGVIDDSSLGSRMSIPEMRNAFEKAEKETGESIDLICFDACYMATVEVANELSEIADFMVASQNVIHSAGFPYSLIFGDNEDDATTKVDFNLSPRDAASKIVKVSSDSKSIRTLSAIDLSKIDGLRNSVNQFAQTVIEGETEKSVLRDIALTLRTFNKDNTYKVIDLYNFACLIIESDLIKESALKDAAQNILDSVENTVFENYSERDFEDAHGLSIEASPRKLNTNKYQALSFANASLWDDVLGESNIIFEVANKVKTFLGV